MFAVIQKNNDKNVVKFNTEDEAVKFWNEKGRAKNFFKVEKLQDVTNKTVKKPTVNWKETVDFTGAVNINRDNVKYYYNKSGYIKVVDNTTGDIKHIGKTKNMGKVFSNYVNCARYNQSYDFDLNNGDRLYFKEASI